MSLYPDPAIAVEGLTWSCVCGQERACATSREVTADAELHALHCAHFRRRAHEQIDNLSYTLGYYMPAQVLELLHVLVDQPSAAAQIMPWLAGLEDRDL